MKEQEFDIYVRNVLRDAEESVSPEVWEGVAAGLDRRKKVVPFWRWTAAAATAAAAAVAGFIFLKPSADTIENHSQPTSIFIVESAEESAPQQTLPAPSEKQEELLPIRKQLAGKQVRVAQPLPALPQPAQPEAAPAEEVPSVTEEMPEEEAQAPVAIETPDVLQASEPRWEQWAGEEKKSAFGRGLALTASGNVQGNQRQQTGSFLPPRQYGAPVVQQGEGIRNASPETSFSLPISVGVGLTYYFAPRWSVGTGIRYTYLGRTFMGDYVSGDGYAIVGTDIDNRQHWLGVPLNLYFSFLDQGNWHLHAFGGGSVEFLLHNDYLVHNTPKDIHYVEGSKRPQWSANLGLGLEYQLTPQLSLYLDPQFRYYFGPENQPRSLRTIQPLRFDIEAGLRFNLGK